MRKSVKEKEKICRFFMKRILSWLFLITCVSALYAQSYNMPTGSRSAQYTICGGTFYDAGGSNGNHGTNQKSTITFNPSTQGMSICLTFSVFRVGEGATMKIFDGIDTTAALIATYDPDISPLGIEVAATANNPTGALTVKFISGTRVSDGWVAAISCHAPCQPYTIFLDEIHTTKPLVDGMYFNVCKNEEVTFCAKGNYPQSGQLYEQSDDNVTFTWQFFSEDTPYEGQCVTKVFDEARGYQFQLSAKDAQNCYPTAVFKGRVRVSDNIIRDIASLPDACSGTEVPLMIDTSEGGAVVIDPFSDYTSATLNLADQTFLPDGSGVSYHSELTYTVFEPGQTLTNINDLLGICLDLEHSYLGDLAIRITCPSGQSCLLKAYSGESVTGSIATPGSTGGGDIHLGFAPDPFSGACYTTPGVPLTYCFTPQSTAPMGTNGPTTRISYTDPCGNTESWKQLNAGDYGSYESMSVLLGCQLNGAWKITVTDNLSSDNGYIFSWGLSLNPDIIPGGWGYEVGLDTVYWSDDNLTPNSGSNHSFEGTIHADEPGTFNYQITIVDEYGCEYRDNIPLKVIPTPEPNLPETLSICPGTQNATLDPAVNYFGPSNLISYRWNNGETTSTISVNDVGSYYLTVTTYNSDHSLACTANDTTRINASPIPVVDFDANHLADCTPLNTLLRPHCSFDDGGTHPEINLYYDWTVFDENYATVFTSTEQSPNLTLTARGKYSVKLVVRTENGCSDSMIRENYLTVYPQPQASFDYRISSFGVEDGGICNFVNTTDISNFNISDNIEWHWNYGDGQESNDFDGPHEYEKSGLYTVTLDIYTGSGCYDQTSNTIRIPSPYYFYIPNSFSPNEDGNNDIFKPYGYGMKPETFEMLIFDRTGRLVFHTTNYEQGWDGKDNGKLAPFGAYVYVIRTESMDGEKKEYSGTVTVIR